MSDSISIAFAASKSENDPKASKMSLKVSPRLPNEAQGSPKAPKSAPQTPKSAPRPPWDRFLYDLLTISVPFWINFSIDYWKKASHEASHKSGARQGAAVSRVSVFDPPAPGFSQRAACSELLLRYLRYYQYRGLRLPQTPAATHRRPRRGVYFISFFLVFSHLFFDTLFDAFWCPK